MTNQVRSAVFAAPLTQAEILQRSISTQLIECGISLYLPEFPFKYNHDYYREKFSLDGKHLKKSDVGNFLREWASERDHKEDYIWQAVCGALLYHFKKSPQNRSKIPSDINEKISRLKFGYDFEKWLRLKTRNIQG